MEGTLLPTYRRNQHCSADRQWPKVYAGSSPTTITAGSRSHTAACEFCDSCSLLAYGVSYPSAIYAVRGPRALRNSKKCWLWRRL
jgi:hypothetical protein